MLRTSNLVTAAFLMAISCWFLGCADPGADPDDGADTMQSDTDAGHDHDHGEEGHTHDEAGHDHGEEGHDEAGHADDTDSHESAMMELSPEDRMLAQKQKVCVVGGGELGSMGTPVKVDLKGKTAFLCCEGCKSAVEESPDKYLAKLEELTNE